MSNLVRGAAGQGIHLDPKLVRPMSRINVDGVLVMIWGNESQHTDGGSDLDFTSGPYYPTGHTAFNEDKTEYAAAYSPGAAVRLMSIEYSPADWGLDHMIPTSASLPGNLEQEGWPYTDYMNLAYFQDSYNRTLAQLPGGITPTDIYLLVDNSDSMYILGVPGFGLIIDYNSGYTLFKNWLDSDTLLTIHETLFEGEAWLAQATLALDDHFA